jgi:hypothetical protein
VSAEGPPRKRVRTVNWLIAVGVAVAILVYRCRFLAGAFEDTDSVNFALGVEGYDPIAYRPHPPGFPVFILAAKLIRPFFASTVATLSCLSVLMSALSLFPLYALMRRVRGRDGGASLVCALTLFCPVVAFNSVRPMSDLAGFFAATLAQCLLVATVLDADRPRGGWALCAVAAFAAALSLGTRMQTVFLVGPMLLYAFVRLASRRRVLAFWSAVGLAAWLLPLFWVCGGPVRWATATLRLFGDALPTEPLLANPSLPAALRAAANTFLVPWYTTGAGWTVVALAGFGLLILAFSDRCSLKLLLLLYGPYALYHYCLQWTETPRYAIPIVPLVAALATVPAVLACRAVRVLPSQIAIAVAVLMSALISPALQDYHSKPSPPVKAIECAAQYASSTPGAVVSAHFGFGRYLEWLPKHVRVLWPALENQRRALIDYWKAGGRGPVFFLRRSARTGLLLIDPTSQTAVDGWSWSDRIIPMVPSLPRRIELVRIDPPRWFCESGFLLAREAGSPDRVAREPHVMYVRPARERQMLVLAGSMAVPGQREIRVRVGGRLSERQIVEGSFAFGTRIGPLDGDAYVPVSIDSSDPVLLTNVGLQSEGDPTIELAGGFYLPERDRQATLFRWMAPQARALAYIPGRASRLVLRGRVPIRYFRKPITLTVTAGDQRLGVFAIDREEFRLECEIPAALDHPWVNLTLTASQSFVPDEVEGNGDYRMLAIQVYELRLEHEQ